jgi:hypothetical protein
MDFGEAVQMMVETGATMSWAPDYYMRYGYRGLEDGLYRNGIFVWEEVELTDDDITSKNWEEVPPAEVPDVGDALPRPQLPVVERRCANCNYYVAGISILWDDRGQCRRYPPVLQAIASPSDSNDSLHPAGQFSCLFPETPKDEWCGEFRERIHEDRQDR